MEEKGEFVCLEGKQKPEEGVVRVWQEGGITDGFPRLQRLSLLCQRPWQMLPQRKRPQATNGSSQT